MTRPDIRFRSLEMHLAADPSLPARFGRAIKQAGGKYTEIRGNAGHRRYVTLPMSETALIDAVAQAYKAGPKTVFVARDFGDVRAERALGSDGIVFNWNPATEASASAFVARAFAARLDNPARYDWPAITGRWKADDDAAEERRRAHALRTEYEDLKVEIAAEALRVLDGANDLSDLKHLAARLRDVLAEAGIDEPTRSPADLESLDRGTRPVAESRRSR